MKINVGCGPTPTAGWVNFDNSPTVRFSRWDVVIGAMARIRVLAPNQVELAHTAKASGVQYATATHLPLGDHSVEAVYSSHMMEHLDRSEAQAFLAECRRVLQPGGIIRLALPDLELMVREYTSSGDADRLIVATDLARAKVGGVRGVLKALLVGDRGHHWMYDGSSTAAALLEAGFVDPRTVPAGQTTIADPGELNLYERSDESVYVEATSP